LSATAEDYEVMVKTKAADLAEIRSQLATSRAEGLALRKELDSKARAVKESDSRVAQASKDQERLKASLARTEKELDSLRNLMAARRSEEAQRAEVEASREKELLALRDQLSKLSKHNASEIADARKAVSELEAKYSVATTELQRVKLEKAKSEADLSALAQKLEGMQTVIKSGEAVKRGLDSDLAETRQRLIQQQAALAEVTSSRDVSSFSSYVCEY
jgi:myosin protein heavy chain